MGEKEIIQRAIELCLAVYRVTDQFPAYEILREKLRSASLDIIEGIIYDLEKGPTRSRFFNSNKVKVLTAYFDIAARQGWAKEKNFTVLKAAYNGISGERKVIQNEPETPAELKLSERQKSILRILERKSTSGKIDEIAKSLNISSKTVARDLKPMVGQGIVRKYGTTKAARFYLGDE